VGAAEGCAGLPCGRWVFRPPSVALGAESPLRVHRSCFIDDMRAPEQARAPRARDNEPAGRGLLTHRGEPTAHCLL